MMRVEQVMRQDVTSCRPGDGLDVAARIMWEHDCGCVPVVEPANGAGRLVGMVTDRDICMAAWIQGRPLSAIHVDGAMARRVQSCRATDSIDTALKILEQNQLHRLPVVDQDDRLVGMLSLADLAREAAREHGRAAKDVTDRRIGEVVEAISASRATGEITVAV